MFKGENSKKDIFMLYTMSIENNYERLFSFSFFAASETP